MHEQGEQERAGYSRFSAEFHFYMPTALTPVPRIQNQMQPRAMLHSSCYRHRLTGSHSTTYLAASLSISPFFSYDYP